MRFVTWNLNRATWQHRRRFKTAEAHRLGAWSALAGLDAQVALLQEAPPPPVGVERPPMHTVPAGTDPEDWRSLPGPKRLWCAAVASWGPPLEPFDIRAAHSPLDATHQGAYRIARVPWGDKVLVVISVYALWDYAGLPDGAKPRYSETSLHRTLSDLTPILDQWQPQSHHVLLAGDLNASTQFPPPYRQPYRLVHERIKALGLINVSERTAGPRLAGCPCEDNPCRHLRTLEGPTPYQDDYIYASPELADAMRLIDVARTDTLEAVSDHFPLVAEIPD